MSPISDSRRGFSGVARPMEIQGGLNPSARIASESEADAATSISFQSGLTMHPAWRTCQMLFANEKSMTSWFAWVRRRWLGSGTFM